MPLPPADVRPVRPAFRPLELLGLGRRSIAAAAVATAVAIMPPAGAAAAATATAATATTAAAGEFPDEWFFSGANRPEALKALEGQPAPEIAIDTWIGDEVSIEELRGDVIIVDFWATWCGPCMAAIPKNVELVKEYADQGLHFIGVHDSNSGWNTADQVVRDKSINYPVGLDRQGESVKAYSLSFWPTYVAIDRKGIVRAAGLTPDKVGDVVRVLLAEKGPARPGGGTQGRTTSEFPVEWFTGDGPRLSRLLALEGTPAPAIGAAEWLGATEADRATRGRVVVMHFLAPWSRRTTTILPELVAQAAELRRQGVVVLGVSDHASDLDGLASSIVRAAGENGAADAGQLPFPLARDLPPAEDARLPIGGTAAAYGVRMWPMSVIVDRAGTIRAAGIRPERIPDVVSRLMAERLVAPPADGDADDDAPARGDG